MKLLGVEFTDFACFEHEFVPIRAGMNLLVGRNNAGKTALLRGLSALSALPIGDSPGQVPTDLSGYVRHPHAVGLAFDVVMTIEDSERSFFEGMPLSSWARVLANGIARWRFSIRPGSRQVSFLRCTFEIPGAGAAKEEVDVISVNSGVAISTQLRYPDMAQLNSAQITSRSLPVEGTAPTPVFKQGQSLTLSLEQFGSVKPVSPHRVVLAGHPLQTALDLPSDGRNLAPFLMTLHGRDRDTFEAIEKFVTKVFPEFRHVNPVSNANNQVAIDLTERSTNRRVALENCGTGVEQILSLATFILTTPKPGLLLLDEPHSYLHPTAERALVQFLAEHPEHSYVISTHSAVLMNSVEPDRITHVSPPGRGYTRSRESSDTSRILFDLGYKNSDAMFNDQLILVEGPSDRRIIPILLLKDGEIDQAQLNRTGFPILEGVGKGTTALQTSILRYEKLLSAIGRADQPRVYVFDGDRRSGDKEVLRGTTNPNTGERISASFLPRLEIENYLLAADAITAALREELILKGEPREVSTGEVQAVLDGLLASTDGRLFPQGKQDGAEPLAVIKGSVALGTLYEQYGLPYHKERSGTLIAKYISVKNQSALSEITELVRPLFARR
jgi:ABC-type transport system involved in cytochrome c biogenesis ATPase subunit